MADSLQDFYRDRRVFVTGHTGFKGSWLCHWLLGMGARVTGYALSPPTDPSLFEQLQLRERLAHHEADVRDRVRLRDALVAARPDTVFHLAAQSLVQESYRQPVETFDINVMGTVHVMAALAALQSPVVGVMVTSDKCYENVGVGRRFPEDAPLGGRDPYSASKAAAEIAIRSFRVSVLDRMPSDTRPRVASARAGNVIGGGDYSDNRIVPDAIRALSSGEPIPVRNPLHVRPWQHVLEPLGGYLTLAQALHDGRLADAEPGDASARAWNFGPTADSTVKVETLVNAVLQHWPGSWANVGHPAPHEAGTLSLAIDKAASELGWKPAWNLQETVRATVDWYREVHQCAAADVPTVARRLCSEQIARYIATPQR
ncbi:MAG: CDP-glucose 4,6-dehydratase [Planctomycetota bacterium]